MSPLKKLAVFSRPELSPARCRSGVARMARVLSNEEVEKRSKLKNGSADPLQLTLAILKPDLVQRCDVAKKVHQAILDEGFCVLRSKVIQLTREEAQRFYEEHRGRFFFERLVTYMTSGPLRPIILARHNAISKWREMIGPTQVSRAKVTAPNTIRGKYGVSDTRNSTHGADSPSSVRREIGFFYPNFDVEDWYCSKEELWRSGELVFCEATFQHQRL